jgi:hypothetical protein
MLDSVASTRKAGLGVFILNTTAQQTLTTFVQAHITLSCVVMAEAAALLLASSLVKQLGFTEAAFFTDNRSMAAFYGCV